MELGSKSSHLKRARSIADDGDLDGAPVERRPRFPKGKKVKRAVEASEVEDDEADARRTAQVAARERAKRRSQKREEDLLGDGGLNDISSAEVQYEENANFMDDGIQIEPFNLKQEREEGYFDVNGNFVEYANQNEIKDAWLDNLEVDSRFAEEKHEKKIAEEDYQDLTSEDIGKIKRNIANVLQPGETIIQALKRLKGTSSDQKGKMSEGTKRVFDQLTDDAMKLMENGEYNVYHDDRETFEREAEGYERLARAKEGSSRNEDNDDLDMFAEEDEENREINVNQQTDSNVVVSGSVSEQIPKMASENLEPSQYLHSEDNGGVDSDYVFDQASGYYYSSSLGYYYDPSSGLYCCASSGKWYSFDEQTGGYVECQTEATTETETACA